MFKTPGTINSVTASKKSTSTKLPVFRLVASTGAQPNMNQEPTGCEPSAVPAQNVQIPNGVKPPPVYKPALANLQPKASLVYRPAAQIASCLPSRIFGKAETQPVGVLFPTPTTQQNRQLHSPPPFRPFATQRAAQTKNVVWPPHHGAHNAFFSAQPVIQRSSTGTAAAIATAAVPTVAVPTSVAAAAAAAVPMAAVPTSASAATAAAASPAMKVLSAQELAQAVIDEFKRWNKVEYYATGVTGRTRDGKCDQTITTTQPDFVAARGIYGKVLAENIPPYYNRNGHSRGEGYKATDIMVSTDRGFGIGIAKMVFHIWGAFHADS